MQGTCLNNFFSFNSTQPAVLHQNPAGNIPDTAFTNLSSVVYQFPDPIIVVDAWPPYLVIIAHMSVPRANGITARGDYKSLYLRQCRLDHTPSESWIAQWNASGSTNATSSPMILHKISWQHFSSWLTATLRNDYIFVVAWFAVFTTRQSRGTPLPTKILRRSKPSYWLMQRKKQPPRLKNCEIKGKLKSTPTSCNAAVSFSVQKDQLLRLCNHVCVVWANMNHTLPYTIQHVATKSTSRKPVR